MRSKKAANSREAERSRSRQAKKQKSKEAEKWERKKSREAFHPKNSPPYCIIRPSEWHQLNMLQIMDCLRQSMAIHHLAQRKGIEHAHISR